MIAFMKKEWMEHVKTYKLLILFSVFFIFGMMSPLLAKLMPEIMSGMEIEGMTITLAEPTAMDSYMQFFKNMNQMGLLVLVLVFSGMLTQELVKGTLVNMLTKGLSRTRVILAKYLMAVLLWSIGLVIAFMTTYGYTVYLFPNDPIVNLAISVSCLWLFGVWLLALLMFAQTLVNSQYGNLLFVALSVGLLFMINLIPSLQKYNPLTLVSNNVAMLVSEFDKSSLMPSVYVSSILTVLLLWSAILIFKNKRI